MTLDPKNHRQKPPRPCDPSRSGYYGVNGNDRPLNYGERERAPLVDPVRYTPLYYTILPTRIPHIFLNVFNYANHVASPFTVWRVRVILNHRRVKSRFNSRPRDSERSGWSLRRPRPLSGHYSSRDRERCRLTCARSASNNA